MRGIPQIILFHFTHLMPDGSPKRRKLIVKLKAIKIVEVLKDTGKINLTESHRRMYPNQKEITHVSHKMEMLKDGVMDEVEKILQIRDKDLLKKITPEAIAQDLIDDLNMLNKKRDEAGISIEDMVKVINAKGIKQKLLGSMIAAWKAERPAEREKTAEELINALNLDGGSENNGS